MHEFMSIKVIFWRQVCKYRVSCNLQSLFSSIKTFSIFPSILGIFRDMKRGRQNRVWWLDQGCLFRVESYFSLRKYMRNRQHARETETCLKYILAASKLQWMKGKLDIDGAQEQVLVLEIGQSKSVHDNEGWKVYHVINHDCRCWSVQKYCYSWVMVMLGGWLTIFHSSE